MTEIDRMTKQNGGRRVCLFLDKIAIPFVLELFLPCLLLLCYKKQIDKMKELLLLSILFSISATGLAIWCYQCTSATPGCNTPFNWRGIGYFGNPCPDDEDICIKLIERKGAQESITRDCLSNFKAFRTDIPADTYEGCRPAAKDENLAHYVNNSIKELDTKRNWYDETEWCFCFLDHRCNGATTSTTSTALLIASAAVVSIKLLF